MSLHDLVKNNQHEEIARLNGCELNPFKAVAYIHMGDFKQALKHASKGSFEMAYILYKLKKYKKALRILRQIRTEGSQVLASQCLYYLGYYNTAYQILSKLKKDDDIVVNLQAMKSLAILADKRQFGFGGRFIPRKMDKLVEFEDLREYMMSSSEGRADFVFNLSFEKLDDEAKFVDFLEEEVRCNAELRGTIVEEQMKNVKGHFEDIKVNMLSKSQRETFDFNTRAISGFSNPLHFQKNFLKSSCDGYSESLLIEEVYRSGFNIRFDRVPELSAKLIVFRMLVLYKNGYVPSSKCLEDRMNRLDDEWIKTLLGILKGERDGEKASREEYVRVLREISSLNVGCSSQLEN